MNFSQFGLTNSIVSGVESVDLRIMSILHINIIRKNQYVFQFLRVKITPSKTSDSIPKFPPECTMVNMLLHRCCAAQIDSSRRIPSF